MTDDLIKRLRLTAFYGIQDVVEERDTARRLLAAATQMQTETQAKLAKAMEALRDTTQMLSQCTFTNIRIRGQYFERHEVVDKANAVLAELEEKE